MSKDRPTILQIIPHLDTGGAELSAVEVATAIVQAGGRAIVLADGGRLAERIVAAGGEVRPFPAATKNPAKMLANAGAIVRMIAADGVDLVHARSRAPAWSALMAARRAGVPFVTTYHGAYNETNALKRAYNSVMARGDIVIANSRYIAELVAGRYGTPTERIVVIHRGVDAAAFDPAAIAPERVRALRELWGVDAATRVILLAARLTSWKGQRVLIDAARRLLPSGAMDDAVVVLAGHPQGREAYVRSLQDDIAGAGLQGKVLLVGHVEDIAAAYATAYVTVVASIEPEAFGRSAIEAAALGCPVVATAIGAPPETVVAASPGTANAATGWLVPPGDGAALAEVLAEALAMPAQQRTDMGNSARQHVLANFTTSALQRRTLGVYDRLLGTLLERRFAEATGQQKPVAIPPTKP